MSIESSKTTKFGVARGNKLVSDGYDTPAIAQQQHAHMTESMEALSLKPDLHVVEFEVETIVGRPRTYVEPTDQDDTIPDADLPSTIDSGNLKAGE